MPDLDTSAKEVIYRIFRVRDRLNEKFLDDLKKVGLNDASFHLLTALRRSGEPYRLAPTELTKRYLTVTSGGVTQLIDRLSRKGLVIREHNADDRRGVFVKLTQAGLELIDEAIVARVEHEQRALAGLSQADQEALSGILHRLLDALEP
jgi:DNA-binding MarR family transcriptional regulator